MKDANKMLKRWVILVISVLILLLIWKVAGPPRGRDRDGAQAGTMLHVQDGKYYGAEWSVEWKGSQWGPGSYLVITRGMPVDSTTQNEERVRLREDFERLKKDGKAVVVDSATGGSVEVELSSICRPGGDLSAGVDHYLEKGGL